MFQGIKKMFPNEIISYVKKVIDLHFRREILQII